MNSDHDKEVSGADALATFFGQFGEPDVYTRILLEVLFEELLGIKNAEAKDGVNGSANH